MPLLEEGGATDLSAPPASPARTFASRVAIITAAATAITALIALAEDATLLFRIAKPLPAVALAVWTALLARSRAARVVAFGLVASAAGDALLDIKGAFIAGMAAFAVAHIAYIFALVREHRRLDPLVAIPFLLWGAGLFFYVRAGLGGPLVIPVAVYAVILSAMMWRAAARYSMNRTGIALIGLAGAVLFGFSDSIIALRLSGASFTGMSAVILTTYWIGQAGIAASFIVK